MGGRGATFVIQVPLSSSRKRIVRTERGLNCSVRVKGADIWAWMAG